MVYIYTHTYFLKKCFYVQQWFEIITCDLRTYHPEAFVVCSDVCSTSQTLTVLVPQSFVAVLEMASGTNGYRRAAKAVRVKAVLRLQVPLAP